MKFSIFTPSHNLKRIQRTIDSLANQSFKDFEWIICLNNAALNSDVELQAKLMDKGINYKILKWEGDTPTCFNGITTYNHSEILTELAKNEWSNDD